MTPGAPSAAERRASVRWGNPAHALILQAGDPRVIGRAAVVFQPWAVPDEREGVGTPLIGSWTIDEQRPAGPWNVWRDGAMVAERATLEQAVTAVEFQGVLALYERPDVLAFHAALVAKDGRAVLVCGPCGAGKSTLACALWQRGWSLFGDDTTIVDADDGTARPAPRRVSLRASSRALIGEGWWTRMTAAAASEATAEGWLFHPHEIDGVRPDSAQLAACVFLARMGADVRATGPSRLARAHAAVSLLPYANQIRHVDAGTLIERLASLAARTPCYDLPRAPIADMAATVDRLLESDVA